MHLSLVFKAFGPLNFPDVLRMETNRDAANRHLQLPGQFGTGKGVITKRVFSLEESLEFLKSLNSLESLENGPILLCFPESGGSKDGHF